MSGKHITPTVEQTAIILKRMSCIQLKSGIEILHTEADGMSTSEHKQ